MAREIYGAFARYNFPRAGERSALGEPPNELRVLASLKYARAHGFIA